MNRVFTLLQRYKLRALPILAGIATGRTVQVPVNGKMFRQNVDRSTLYHIAESYPKLQKLVDALPDDLSGVIVDGGANNGLFSFMAHQRFPKSAVFAIEPAEVLSEVLHQNLPHAFILKAALSNTNKEQILYYLVESDQMASLYRSNVEPFGQTYSYMIPAITLNDMVESFGISQIGVLKLDIQGAELLALLAGRKALEITDYLLLEVFLYDEKTIDLLRFVGEYFPYHKAINSIIYGADLLFSKKPLK